MIFDFFRRAPNQPVIDRLHGEIVAAVRQPAFYRDYGIADTFDGRFELLALLSTVTVRRLMALPAPAPDLAQELTDGIFRHLDSTLREMGVGDLTVPKRIKKFAAALLGRRQAYDAALNDADDGALQAALARNAFAGAQDAAAPVVRRLAAYVRAAAAVHADAPLAVFLEGQPPFPPADSIS
jgi:cytochrome b pre-mRNA-processing protein 3